jgi:RNA polymerase sigma factor (sigma-70 family)
MSDEELIQQFQLSGDNMWLGCLLERYTMLLLGIAMKYLKDKTQAQDAVQQVFVKVLSQFPAEDIRNFKGWLYIIMRNYCFGVLRSTTYNTNDDVLANIAAPESKSKDEWMSDERMRQQMNEALDTLPPEQQLSLKLFYLEQRSYKEIMEHTNFTFEQVKSFIQNGKRNLKIALLKLNQTKR